MADQHARHDHRDKENGTEQKRARQLLVEHERQRQREDDGHWHCRDGIDNGIAQRNPEVVVVDQVDIIFGADEFRRAEDISFRRRQRQPAKSRDEREEQHQDEVGRQE